MKKTGEARKGNMIAGVVAYLCLASKDIDMQRKCSFYEGSSKYFCRYLGDWKEGYQTCKNDSCKQDYLKRITQDQQL